MRRKITIFLIINIFTVGFLVHSFWPLICLLFASGVEDQISRAEIPAPQSESIEEIPQIVPKIIHQTYITCDVPRLLNGSCTTRNIPDMWDEAFNSCKELHPDYEYMFWQDKNARDFVVAEYPWFVSVWDSYSYPIQRADAIRYFALEHYGGVYIDLDNGCQRRLDPLLAYPAWVRRSHPTGIGNDVIGVIPHHPFIRRVIDSLPRYNFHWFSPYITIMSSTGPLFFSLIWQHYTKGDGIGSALLRTGFPASGEKLLGTYGGVPTGEQRVRILFGDEYMGNSWSFFSHHMGSSWHMWDAKAIFWMSQHWLELTIAGFLVGFAVIFFLYYLFVAVSGGRGFYGRAGNLRLPVASLARITSGLVPSMSRFRYSRLKEWKPRKEESMELAEAYDV